jgi:hypothetical protein
MGFKKKFLKLIRGESQSSQSGDQRYGCPLRLEWVCAEAHFKMHALPQLIL